jgi:hypothetical protein
MALIPFAKPTLADAQNSSKVSQSQYSTPKHTNVFRAIINPISVSMYKDGIHLTSPRFEAGSGGAVFGLH